MELRNQGSSQSQLPFPNDLTSQLITKIEGLPSRPKTDYLKEHFLSKYVSSDTDPAEVRRTRAISKWLATERENEATNERLLTTHGKYNILPGVTFDSFVSWCCEYIRSIIGDTAPVEALIGSFSGGASTSRSRTCSHPATKYLGKADVTPSCLGLFSTIVEEMPGWVGAPGTIQPRMVRGNILFTVPKKTEIDRVACKEPDLNMFIQKGIGTYFRKCLRRTGINLNDQSVNRSLAQKGSTDKSLATLDLSSASDSVSQGLVALFLPECWYTLLDAARCQVTIIDGEEHRNSMFSSMGNGFTFELESLLFYVLARAVARFTKTKGIISVYGDDIICPTWMAHDLVWVLKYFGFSTNEEKSCIEGPIRESCGGHYYNGSDITPFYLRSPIETVTDIIHIANSIRRWSENEYGFFGYSTLDDDLYHVWYWLKSFVPECLWGGGDTSFKYQLVSLDTSSHRVAETTKKRNVGIGGYYHWLNATWFRTEASDGVSTSSLTEIKPNKLRLRPVLNPTVPQLFALFLAEYE